ncbi:YfcL family protein [Alteromonas sp. ASW11-19]|uniref:YfcL family protein n=1 Tax=Alteromonas salexigens TaxID=2982530 RepID=A0ABT2VVS0_9ALTE|nr:YfcL family protein [Alteromonas salexigens]MCU7555944.1 YfcL family protein [Alteromonas salexigens]
MLPPAAASDDFVGKVHNIEQSLDDVVNHGSDDELFVASYLQGHFAVISKQLEMQADATLDKLDAAMQDSLDAAFANRELEPDDQQAVAALWARLRATNTEQ